MKRLLFLPLFLAVFTFVRSQEEFFDGQSCTSIMAGRKATVDGSVITSHTCDGRYRTWLSVEPAADYPEGAMMPVYKGTAHTVSRDDTTGVRLAGEIPQVRHTFAYLNTAYPCMNEKQLAIGETTFGGPDTLRNPDGMFLIEELQRVALQRCSTARDAVVLIGSLVERYGYGDGGECITLADKNEVWQMEILGAGRHAKGGVWAAQRIPDDHVAISANIPRIGRLQRNNPAAFLCSDNAESVARQHGLWDGKGEFVFWRAFLPEYAGGRNFREREFFILNALAPSLHLNYEMDELPFSVRPDSNVSVECVMALLRSTYEGTDMDMCRNVLMPVERKNSEGDPYTDYVVSPLANPWMTSAMQKTLNYLRPGTVDFRRTVSVAWCSYSWVAQLRGRMPDAVGGVCWFSVDNPGQSPRIPVFAGTTRLPDAFGRCGQKRYDPNSLLWQYRKANKLATLAWQRTKKEMTDTLLHRQQAAFDGLRKLESDVQLYYMQGMISDCARLLDGYTERVYLDTRDAWAALEARYWHLFGMGF
ncbi:MAG: secreted peptidase [bacterium P3]|nr:MAG: secreted peptidase [bacterium P3]KWW41970.1 MAG: secreted peptidase [bacterium F083]